MLHGREDVLEGVAANVASTREIERAQVCQTLHRQGQGRLFDPIAELEAEGLEGIGQEAVDIGEVEVGRKVEVFQVLHPSEDLELMSAQVTVSTQIQRLELLHRGQRPQAARKRS